MVIVTNKSGMEFEIPLELAKKFIQSWDIEGDKTIEWNFVEWQVEPVIEELIPRKNVVRKIKTKQN